MGCEMKKSKLVNVLFVIIVLTFNQIVYAIDAEKYISPEKVVKDTVVSCPSVIFSDFIRVFSESGDVQRTFTKIPLKKQNLNLDEEPEPKEIIRFLTRQQIKFPVMPLKQERINKLLQIRIDKVSSNKAQVSLIKPDIDYQVMYFFTKKNCWRLEKIEDWSL